MNNSELSLPTFLIYRLDRNKNTSNFTIVYKNYTISSNFIYVPILSLEELHFHNIIHFVISLIYIPPNMFNIVNDLCSNYIKEICRKYPSSNIILLGDFNFLFIILLWSYIKVTIKVL